MFMMLIGEPVWKMPAEHDQIDIERPKIPAWPEDVRQQTVRDESPRRMPNCPPIAAADSVREGRPSGQLWRRICAISLCTGMLAALCFVCGSLLGSAMGGSRWSPELMDFTNFIGILVLFVGMAGAGCVTLKLTTSEDAFSQALKYRVWASVPFSSLQLGVAPPAFQTYLVQGNGHFERHGPAVKKELKASEVILSESVSCTCCLSEFDGADTVAVLPCGHIFCEPCIAAWASSRSIQSSKCPLCRITFDVEASAVP